MNKKTDIDYLNYTDLNTVESVIDEYTERISRYVEIPAYVKKTWAKNDLPFVQEIDRIENAITNIGRYGYKPDGWLPTKTWITSDNLYPVKSFDYRDWNRWINNLQLINFDDIDEMTFWNGVSLIDWNTESDYEWIDASTYIIHEIMHNNDEVLYENDKLRVIERK